MNLLRPLLFAIAVLSLAACETIDYGKHILATAAGGTEVQAERLVAKMLGKPSKPLPYRNGEIDRSLTRMTARWSQIVAELKHGSIGLTDDGMLRLRQADGRLAELKKLIRAENYDRQALYRGICAEVGYYDGNTFHWMPFTEDTFGKEWIKQAPAGWWYIDEAGNWQRK